MPLVDRFSPPLTTIRIPHYEIGVRAAEVLLESLRTPDAEPRQLLLQPNSSARGSSAPPRGKLTDAAPSAAANDCAIVGRRLSQERTAADETPVGEPERSAMSDVELPVDGPTEEGDSAAPEPTAQAGTRPAIDEPARFIEGFERMVLIREFEQEIHRLFLKGEVHGTTHLCGGPGGGAGGRLHGARAERLRRRDLPRPRARARQGHRRPSRSPPRCSAARPASAAAAPAR